jgi:hypothetical protein
MSSQLNHRSPARGATATLERRAALRHHSDSEIPCAAVPETEDEPWLAHVQDISTTGIGIIVDRYVEPETFLAVQMHGDDELLSYTVLVQVRNLRTQGDGSWRLGCEFARELTEEEVRTLL